VWRPRLGQFSLRAAHDSSNIQDVHETLDKHAFEVLTLHNRVRVPSIEFQRLDEWELRPHRGDVARSVATALHVCTVAIGWTADIARRSRIGCS
jgi:hypothetical protein